MNWLDKALFTVNKIICDYNLSSFVSVERLVLRLRRALFCPLAGDGGAIVGVRLLCSFCRARLRRDMELLDDAD